MRAALALIIPACAIGTFVLPRPLLGARSLVSAVTLSVCLGIGFSSLVSTALIVSGLPPATDLFVLIDAAIWIGVGVLGWWLRRPGIESGDSGAGNQVRSAEGPKLRAGKLDWILRIAFGTAAIVALMSVIESTVA
jgi:hypothetical protein